MRLAFIIICIASIAVGLVLIRKQDLVVRYQQQRIHDEHEVVRTEIWDYWSEAGRLSANQRLKRRIEALGLEMISDPGQDQIITTSNTRRNRINNRR